MLSSATQLQNSSFHVVEGTRTSSKCQKMKNARAKCAEILLFIVKYANLWGFCCRRRHVCLSSLLGLTPGQRNKRSRSCTSPALFSFLERSFRFSILFSQYRSCDDTLELNFVLFIYATVIWNPRIPSIRAWAGHSLFMQVKVSEVVRQTWVVHSPATYCSTHGTRFVKQLIIAKRNTLVKRHCWQPWNEQIDLWATSK